MSVDHIRGYRNNNPGNIEKGSPWQGLARREEMTAVQKKERRFAVFVHPKWGIRAIARILITYQDRRIARDGSSIDTVADIIDRWAPSSENDTRAYVRAVRQAMGIERGRKVDVHQYEYMRPLVEAIIHHELGVQPYPDDLIDEGLRLAGISPPSSVVSKAPAVKGVQGVTGATAGVGVVAAVVEQLDPALPLLTTLIEYAPWAIAAMAVVALAYVVWKQTQKSEVQS